MGVSFTKRHTWKPDTRLIRDDAIYPLCSTCQKIFLVTRQGPKRKLELTPPFGTYNVKLGPMFVTSQVKTGWKARKN